MPPQIIPPIIPSWGLTGWGFVAERIIDALIFLAGIIAVIGIIVGGYWYITSGGNPDQAAKGKNALFGSLIGIAIILAAYAIINFIGSRIFG